MKRIWFIALIIPLLFLSTTTNGQTWLDIGSKWHHNEYSELNNEAVVSFQVREVVSDTVINQRTVKVVENIPGGKLFMYEENGAVYLYHPITETFDLFYSLEQPIGSPWKIQRVDLPLEFLTVTVLDTTTLDYNLNQLKALIVNIEYSGTFNYQDTIVERIGYLGMFAPHMPGIIDATFRGIRCFEDSTLGFIDFNENIGCEEALLSSDGIIAQLDFQVFPNPFLSTISLEPHDQFSENEISVQVFDMVGVKVFESQEIYHKADIDLSRLHSGMYLLVVSSNKITNSTVIIKQ